jgi:endonuclease YncB( thermonuclease family)
MAGAGALALALLGPGLVASAPEAAAAQVVDGLAIVQEDGTLSVGGTHVRLFGIYIPQFERTCRTSIRPPRCAPKAVLVLDGKVTGFVRCEIVLVGGDGVPQGVCGVRGRDLFGPREDLAAWLVQEGFALAAPGAPPEYVALERLAQSRELGLWGDKILNLR